MNSLDLLQRACSNWLTVQDQSSLTLPETEMLCAKVNDAVTRIWRKLPVHYRRQTFSCAFGAAVTGTIAATAGSRAATFSFTGSPQSSEGREFCTLSAGSVRNEYRSGSLLHPWQDSTGTHAATIYHDATIKLGYLVDRVLSPMQELRSGCIWFPAPPLESSRLWACTSRFYDIQRVSFLQSDGFRSPRTLFRVAPYDAAGRLFESVVQVVPVPLTVVDASSPSELIYDDEIGGIISDAAGIELQTHPKFKGAPLNLAVDALAKVELLPQRVDTGYRSFGTPSGW